MDKEKMKIAIDCDDVSVELKKTIYEHIKSKGIEITDISYLSYNSNASYPEIGYNLALKIQQGEYNRAILLCGTGLGMSMIANKVKGVYAGVCHDVYSAQRLKKSNDAQIMTMGSKVVGSELAKLITDAWLESDFEAGRSLPKVIKMRELEQQSFMQNSK